MADSSWRRALLKRAKLRARVAANITAPNVPPPLLAGTTNLFVVVPALAPAPLSLAPRADKRKRKTPALLHPLQRNHRFESIPQP